MTKKLSVKELKEILKNNNLPTSGNKSHLLKMYNDLQEKKTIVLPVQNKEFKNWKSTSDKDFMNFINKEFSDFKLNPIDLSIDPCLTNKTEIRQIFEHQKFLSEFFNFHNSVGNEQLKSRGLLLYHSLGSGKTSSALLMANNARIYIDEKGNKKLRKVIVLIPASLRDSPWVEEIGTLNPDFKTQSSQINLGYFILHYNNTLTFLDQLENLQETDSMNPFDNSVVIIDEVHNILNTLNINTDSVRWKLYSWLMTSKNTKIILLSGTPIMNDPYEITFALNILRGKQIFDVLDKYSKEKFYSKFFSDEKIINKNLFKRYTQGLISYYKGINENAFAKKRVKNEFVEMSEEQWDAQIKIFDMELSKIQNKPKATGITQSDFESQIKTLKRGRALKVRGTLAKILMVRSNPFDIENEEQNYFIYSRENSNFNYPKKILFETRQETTQKNNEDYISNKLILEPSLFSSIIPKIDLKNNLKYYSPKFVKCLENIKKSNGPVIVFSNFEGPYGVSIFVKCLEEYLGYSHFSKKNDDFKYAIWSGNTTHQERVEILKNYNSDDNINGNKIKVICLTSAGKEGISLRSVRQIHILEPWWNVNQTFQVIGRGIRICSHSHLPKEDQVVDIFNYISVKPKSFISSKYDSRTEIELFVMKRATEKYKKQLEILELLKECSIDCDLNKEYNNIKNCINFSKFKEQDVFYENIYSDFLEVDQSIIKEVEYQGKKYYLENLKVYEHVQNNPKFIGIAETDIKGNVIKINKIEKLDYEIMIFNGQKYLFDGKKYYQYLERQELEMGIIPIEIKL